jgi:hypothetical protein
MIANARMYSVSPEAAGLWRGESHAAPRAGRGAETHEAVQPG